MMTIINNIHLHQNDFSNSEAKVAAYILENPHHLETFTITKLADRAETSTSAVLRFCQTMGYNGYKDFRFEFMSNLKSNRQLDPQDAHSFIDRYINEFSNLLIDFKSMNENEINHLVNAILNDEMNYIFGMHLSSIPARTLSLGLLDLGVLSMFSDNFVTGGHYANTLSEKSTLIFFSITGNKTNATNFLEAVPSESLENSFLITLNPKSELNQYFNHSIVLPGRTTSAKSIVDLQSLPTIFVEVLLNLIHEKQ